jgi:hypothetical protein
MRKLKHITEVCREIYEKQGQSAVFDYINKNAPGTPFEYCKGCDTDTPTWQHTCLVCGQPTVKPRYKIWVEIERIDNPGTDDESYSDTDFPESIAYRETFEDATELQQQIVKTFGEI